MCINLQCPYCGDDIPYNRGAAELIIECEWCEKSLTLPTIDQLDTESRAKLEWKERKQAIKLDKQQLKFQRKAKRQQEKLKKQTKEVVKTLVKATEKVVLQPQPNTINHDEMNKQMLKAQQQTASSLLVLRLCAAFFIFLIVFWPSCSAML